MDTVGSDNRVVVGDSCLHALGDGFLSDVGYYLACVEVAEPSDLPVLVQDIAGQLHPAHDLHLLVVFQALSPVGFGDRRQRMGLRIDLEVLVVALQSTIKYQRHLNCLVGGESADPFGCQHHSPSSLNIINHLIQYNSSISGVALPLE